MASLLEIMLLTDFVQYWFHRAFHRVPFLWGFHAVHHSAKAMDWLAGSRMHFFEIVALPLFRAYVALVPDAQPLLEGAMRNYNAWLHAAAKPAAAAS